MAGWSEADRRVIEGVAASPDCDPAPLARHFPPERIAEATEAARRLRAGEPIDLVDGEFMLRDRG